MAVRTSATVIMVSWSPLSLEDSRGDVIGYHIKYRPLDRMVYRRNLDDESIVINTTSIELEIRDLDPRLAYAVALAASTAAGMGRYSSETTAERMWCAQTCLHKQHLMRIFVDNPQYSTMSYFNCTSLEPSSVESGW